MTEMNYKNDDSLTKKETSTVPEHVAYFLDHISKENIDLLGVAAELDASAPEMKNQFLRKAISHAELNQLDKLNYVILICPNEKHVKEGLENLVNERRSELSIDEKNQAKEVKPNFWSNFNFKRKK